MGDAQLMERRARQLSRLIAIYIALALALSDCRAVWRGSDANVASMAPYPASRYPARERAEQERSPAQ